MLHDQRYVTLFLFALSIQDGSASRVGNPLAKNYLSRVEDGTLLAMTGDHANQVLTLGKLCSYWKNNKDRIQLVFGCVFVCLVECHSSLLSLWLVNLWLTCILFITGLAEVYYNKLCFYAILCFNTICLYNIYV